MKLDQLSANFPGKLLVLVLLAVEGNLVSLMYLNLGIEGRRSVGFWPSETIGRTGHN